MRDFRDIMSQRTNSELLEITTYLRDDYQPEAVIAAETELKNRNLTDQELADIKSVLDQKRSEKEQPTKTQNPIAEIANAINPVAEKTTERQIKLTAIGLTIIFLIYLVRNWSLAVISVQDIGNADISLLEFFAPIILFPIGLYGFWKMKKYGWIILAILLTYFIVTTMFTIGLETKWALHKPIQFESSGLLQMQEIEDFVLDRFFGKKAFPFYIGQLVVFVGFFIFLNKKVIMEKFVISKRLQLLVIGLTTISLITFGLILLL